MQQFVHDWMQVWVGALFDISKSEGYNIMSTKQTRMLIASQVKRGN